MKFLPCLSGLAVVFLLLVFGASPAQETTSVSDPAREGSTTGEQKIVAPTTEELRIELEAIESDASLEDVVKDSLVKRYQEAIESAEQAASNRALREDFSRALEVGPGEVKQLESELREAREAPPAPPADASLNAEAVEKMLTEIKRERAGLLAKLGEAKTKVTALEGRPEAIPAEVSEAKNQLKEVRFELEGTNPGEDASTRATLAKLRSRIVALESQIEMLETEELSAEIRTSTATLSRDLLAEQIARMDQKIEGLESKAANQVSRDIRRAEGLLEKYSGTEATKDSPQSLLASELSDRIAQLHEAADSLAETRERSATRSQALEKIEKTYNTISAQFEKGVDSKSLSPLLLENLRTLPHPWESSLQLRSLQSQISKAGSEMFQVKQEIESEKDSDSSAGDEADGQEENRSELETVSVQIQEHLLSIYEKLIQELRGLQSTERKLQEVSEDFSKYAESKLFSVRSSTALTPQTFAHLPEAMGPVFGWQKWGQLGQALRQMSPALWIVSFLAFALVAGAYLLLSRWLVKVGIRARHYSTEAFRQTIYALVLTFLLALALPAVLAAAGFVLVLQSGSFEWVRGLGTSLTLSAIAVFPTVFLFEMCRSQGLADAHFRWDRKILTKLRRFCLLLLPFSITAAVAISLATLSFHSDSTLSPLGEIERVPLLLIVIVGGILFAKLLHPEKGIAAVSLEHCPSAMFGKLRAVWYWGAIISSSVLVLLLLIGYVYTVRQLSERIAESLGAVVIAFVLYGIFHRWVMVREHKTARRLREENRKKRQEARNEEEEPGENVSEIVSEDEAESEEEANPVTMREQTRRFLSFFAGLWLLLELHTIWGEFGPLADTIGRIDAVGPLDIGEILYMVVAIAILVSTIRNLPGILEILVFQRTRIDEGTKTAILTLANYAAISIAAVAIFQNLGVDWAQFGWIAAALSVGLGFGLQEVVANFVSGIILLFERPIRVGDVVTIDGVDGRVSRIQIRATTILDWDRKELIVPNKRFITGTLKNWTRSNSINRVVIPVGVAYGTDTHKAREILLDIADKHSDIMEDPGPLATFEAFGDSTLNLVLRAYLANLDNRLGIITELHSQIDQRFKEAGIEIAFPQLDVHLASPDAGESDPA